jgi:hypothetical protein
MKSTHDIPFNNRFRVFEISFVPCSNHRPSRVKIKDTRFNQTILLSRDHDYRDYENQALNYLESIGITVDGLGLTDKKFTLLSSNLGTPIKRD